MSRALYHSANRPKDPAISQTGISRASVRIYTPPRACDSVPAGVCDRDLEPPSHIAT
jgi:hypothetical protein